MALWSTDGSKAPNWAPSVRVAKGWEHAETGELLVAFADTSFTVPATAVISSTQLGRQKKSYKTGEILKLLVKFNQNVKVTDGGNGVPYVPINIGSTRVNLQYVDQAPSVDQATLLFAAEIQPAWTADAGEVVAGQAAVAASTVLGSGNAGLRFVADTAGTAGNSITVEAVAAGNNTALSVGVVGNAITINLATDGAGVATSTATQVKAAVDASGPAAALVNTTLVGDGTGIVAAHVAQSLTGGLAAVAGTAIVLPNLTTIKDLDSPTPTDVTLTFGAAAPDLSAVTVN
jgi:hypothetical protein